jgi:hypothetical protein
VVSGRDIAAQRFVRRKALRKPVESPARLTFVIVTSRLRANFDGASRCVAIAAACGGGNWISRAVGLVDHGESLPQRRLTNR